MRVGDILRAFLVFVLIGLSGCIRYPSSRTDIPDERPSIAFRGAPEGSFVFVDGKELGSATQYDGGKNVLLVESGNHIIELRIGDKVILRRNVFLSGQTTKTFVVR